MTSGHLAFIRQRTVGNDLYIMQADGDGQRSLDLRGPDDWSPDGTRVVFSSTIDGDEEIYVMGVDGTGQVRLTNSAGRNVEPAWSPDGSRIAFVSTRDGDHEIYVMESDGLAQKRLTKHRGYDLRPHWVPEASPVLA